jgi:phage shock protein A
MTEDDFDKLSQKIQGHEGSLSDQSAQIAELQRKVAELSRAIEALQAKRLQAFRAERRAGVQKSQNRNSHKSLRPDMGASLVPCQLTCGETKGI